MDKQLQTNGMNPADRLTVAISRAARPLPPEHCPAVVAIPSYNRLTALLYGRVQTPWGDIFIAFTPEGAVCRYIFTNKPDNMVLNEQSDFLGVPLSRQDNDKAQNIIQQAFAGNLPSTLYVCGTPFQTEVWRMLVRIQRGQVISYSQLAQWIGKPTAVRAVANAVAANPVGYIIPCHRIVRNNGSVGKFAWGSQLKATLIAYERQSRPMGFDV